MEEEKKEIIEEVKVEEVNDDIYTGEGGIDISDTPEEKKEESTEEEEKKEDKE